MMSEGDRMVSNERTILPLGSTSSKTTDMQRLAEPERLVVGAVQVPLRPDHIHPIKATQEVVEVMMQHQQAATTQEPQPPAVDLFVLPELCPVGYSQDTFDQWLPLTPKIQEMHDKIHSLLCQAARDLQAAICYGTIGCQDDDNETCGCFTIRQVVINVDGQVLAEYDKRHLCDYGDCVETRFFHAGTRECSFSLRGFRIGLLICADMRNPVLSRRLVAKHRADVLLQPAAFARDLSFYTWKSFRITRAVENSVYFLGVNYAGSHYGNSCFVPPWVDEEHESDEMECECGVLVGTVERRVLEKVRSEMPFYKQLCSEAWWTCANSSPDMMD